MISLNFDQLAAATGGTLLKSPHTQKSFMGVSIDSRTVKPGELFIALKGERVDGHQYIDQALTRGAGGIIAEFNFPRLSEFESVSPIVTVQNSYEAMLKLSATYRDSINVRRIGISGSNGKTTTKEISYQLLNAVEPNTYRSPGNLNNLFGAPMAIFAMPSQTKLAVMEMGVSLPGEMSQLAEIVQPHIVAITNVAVSHLEFLQTIEGVLKEEVSLVESLPNSAPVVVNGDDLLLVNEIKKIRPDAVTFGVKNIAAFMPDFVKSRASGGSLIVIEGDQFNMTLFGDHQVYNLLAGYAVAKTLGYTFDAVDTSKIEFSTAPMRGQTVTIDNTTYIVDCYNANPDSVRSGLISFEKIKSTGRRVIVLGDMLELGENEVEYHREIGQLLSELHFDQIVLVGPLSRHILDKALEHGISGNKLLHFKNAAEAAIGLKSIVNSGDIVYLKASRGVGLEAIVDAVQLKQGAKS